MCAFRKSAVGAARCYASANASGSSAVARPGMSGSRRIRSFSSVESMLRLLDASCHLFGPMRLLTFENSPGDFDERPGAVKRKTRAPRLRHVRKIFVGERGGGSVRPLER